MTYSISSFLQWASCVRRIGTTLFALMATIATTAGCSGLRHELRDPVFCIAHRGEHAPGRLVKRGYGAPENSLSSIRAAIASGVDGVEFDVRTTSDGIGILVHDVNLQRVAMSKAGTKCPVSKLIRSLTLREIQDNCLLLNGEEITTLTAALTHLRDHDVIAVIELKDMPSEGPATHMARVFDDIRTTHEGHFDEIWIASFYPPVLDASKEYFAKVDGGQGVQYYLLGFWHRQLLHSARLSDDNGLSRGPYQGVSVMYWWSNRRFVGEVNSRNSDVGVWHLESGRIGELRTRRLFLRGVRFITTNEGGSCLRAKQTLLGRSTMAARNDGRLPSAPETRRPAFADDQVHVE